MEFSQEIVPVQGRYGACFCPIVGICLSYSCLAVQVGIEPVISPGAQVMKKGSGAVPLYPGIEVIKRAEGKSKNRDKQLTFIVRVIKSTQF